MENVFNFIIVREGDSYYIREYYVGVWGSLLRELGLLEYDLFIRKWVWNMYSIDSVYSEIDIVERSMVVYRYEYSKDMGEGEYMDIVSEVSLFIDRILGLFESQEERVYRKLKERIDYLVDEYSKSSVNLEDLESEPKKVRAISDLLAIKEKLGVNIKAIGRNRGNKSESLIESM